MPRVVAVTAGAAMLAAGLALGPATPAGAEPGGSAPAPAVPASRHTLTLITGDVVEVRTYPDGRQAVAPRPGRAGRPLPDLKVTERHGDMYVVPSDARPLLAADRLDRELFNVTGLIEAGYDDAHRAALPLVLTYGKDAARTLAAQPAPAGARRTRVLRSASATAVERPPAKAAEFWNAISAGERGRAAAPYAKVWLDRPVRATLADSVPRIGAPAAWQAGLDGKGVKVAVLDTGIDPAHPDVKDRVAETADFTDTTDAVDRNGHGTHVAATVAGSGAASGGKGKGVAPGASLYVGKVLNAKGEGSLSQIVAGMEWAAAQRVDVINLSLGTSEPSDGRDPLSRALDGMSQESGALFVVAAGNSGPQDRTVASPAAADSALTVGAVSKTDELASFSSRGPRLGDDALKPEITAPGVGIVAARAAGTALGTPVDDLHTSLNGTSMATPHVAGAAALLVQRHPDWTPAQLKAALVSTAKPVDGPLDAMGSGRVDVARAVSQHVHAMPGALSLPRAMAGSEPRTATVELVNTGTAPAALDLTLDVRDAKGAPAPAGMFALSTARAEIPAGGRTPVAITVDPAKGDYGRYGGHLRATAPGTEVSVAVAQSVTPELYPVEIDAAYRDGGRPGADSGLDVLNLDTDEFHDLAFTDEGTLRAELPAGRYSMMATMLERRQPGIHPAEFVFAGDPEVKIIGPATVRIDGRRASRIELSTARPVEHAQVTIGHVRQGTEGRGGLHSSWMMTRATERAYAAPIPKAKSGWFEVYHRWDLYAPVATARTIPRGEKIRLVHMEHGPAFDGRLDLPVFDGGTREDFTGVDLRGRLALLTYRPGRSGFVAVESAIAAGVAVVVLANNEPHGALSYWGFDLGAPAFTAGYEEAAKLRKARRVRLEGTPVSPYWYDVIRWHDGMPRDLRYEISPRTMARIEAGYHDTADEQGSVSRASFRPYMGGVAIKPSPIDGAMSRDEWTTGGDLSVRVRADRSGFGRGELMTGDRTYRAGQKVTEHWFAPGGPGQPRIDAPGYTPYGLPPVRTGDTARFMLPEFGDSDPDHFGFVSTPGDRTSARLYRDGTLLHEGDRLYNTAVPMPPERAAYRLEQTSERTEQWWGTAVRTATTHTFTSAHTAERQVLPLLRIDYDLGVDLRNAVRARGRHTFGFTVRHPTGAASPRVAGAKMQLSYDDGATWSDVRVDRRGDGRYAVRADHRRRGGHVSLRVTAWDAAGAKVEQTVIRAFALK
ncbi:S8 family serine peptidase [Spongiactinospora sp. 9N601]|uniref:S8 family serine peptidase n=1 Tax=Spongiactinospora sp. 9N601 TaxID=3375149 RepID=UPI0037B42FBC